MLRLGLSREGFNAETVETTVRMMDCAVLLRRSRALGGGHRHSVIPFLVRSQCVSMDE